MDYIIGHWSHSMLVT